MLWIPSHVGIKHSDTVDRDSLWFTPPPHATVPHPSLLCYRSRIRSPSLLPTGYCRDSHRTHSISIQHDSFHLHRYKYRRRCLMVHKHSVVSTRIRLASVVGHRFISCPVCNSPNSSILQHCCLYFVVSDMLPREVTHHSMSPPLSAQKSISDSCSLPELWWMLNMAAVHPEHFKFNVEHKGLVALLFVNS